jgi:hypothetical protein
MQGYRLVYDLGTHMHFYLYSLIQGGTAILGIVLNLILKKTKNMDLTILTQRHYTNLNVSI